VVVCTCAILFVGIIASNEGLSRFADKRFGLNTSGGYSSFGEQVMSDRSGNNRLSFFKVAVQIFLDNPLGIGLGNFMEENEKITGIWNSAESMYAQMLAEEGLMIVLLFTIVVIVLGGFFVARNRYHNRFYCKIYSAFLITYLITAFFYTAQSEMLGYVMLGATFSTAFLGHKGSLEKQNAAL